MAALAALTQLAQPDGPPAWTYYANIGRSGFFLIAGRTGLMAEGYSNHAIAEQLVVTERAVEKHVTSIFGKLRLSATGESHRRVLAVLAYLRA